jgi:hypothetical protein
LRSFVAQVLVDVHAGNAVAGQDSPGVSPGAGEATPLSQELRKQTGR